MIARFGATAVPWTVSWSSEMEFTLEPEPLFMGRRAISQPSSPGLGKPQFKVPHHNRQRRAIAECLCGLCGKSLKTATKVSLSHARPQPHGENGWAVLQTEPLLHRGCALESMMFCPSLKRDIANGSLAIRQVTGWRVQCAVMDAVYVESVTGHAMKALGHAKVELTGWTDRDLEWLRRR